MHSSAFSDSLRLFPLCSSQLWWCCVVCT
jgi:hypothetical protein